jgi:hypothetical protein
MKIGDVELKGPNIELLVIPRPGGDIIFKAQTVPNFKVFDAMVPPPKPPGRRPKEGFKPDVNDKGYLALLDNYNNQRISWLVITSIQPTNIEWEKVSLDDPTTWNSWSDELQAAGLSEIEVNRIVTTVMVANSLDEKKLEEARQAFILGQEMEASESSGPQTEQVTT